MDNTPTPRIYSRLRSRFVPTWILFLFLNGCGSLPQIIFLQDPLSGEEHLQLGATYESRGEIDSALSEYQAALKKSKEKKTVYFLMGNVYYQKKDYEKAETFYTKATHEDPLFAAAYNNLAWNYWRWGKQEEAREAAQKAVLIEPDQMEYRDTLQQIDRKELP